MKISIIIPVYKEENNINNTINNIYKSQSIDFEIIVVDSEENQSTLNVIKNTQVIKVISEKGRAKQMNKGSTYAKGEVLLFLHADTVLPNNSLEEIIKIIDCGYVGGAFDFKINSNRYIFRIIEKISSLRSRITKIPYGDQGIFIKKDYFIKIGNYKEFPLMEDVELMQRIKSNKNKIFIIKKSVITSSRRWEKEGIIYCTLRNWFLITLYILGVSPNNLIKFYK
jgi:rSAM/selenodomain-associated transferase 2